jgi:enoyl-[acyl-carrier protein] reductase II
MSRAPIPTPITRLLGIDFPVIQAGMSWASSNAALPLAVSRAGGLGVIAAGPMYPEDLARTIDEVRTGTDRPFAVNVPLYRKGVEQILELVAAKRVPILIASQGGPQRYFDRFRQLGTICLHVVAGVEHAKKAAAAGLPGLIVVGAEAGGHPPPTMVSTLVVVRAVARVLPEMPLVASGGFADGAGLAAALALGASAAQFGTRFIATSEANVHRAYKQAVLDAAIEDTAAVGRDLGVIRVIANAFSDAVADLEGSGAPLEARREAFTRASLRLAALDGDVVNGKVEAGQAVGLVDHIEAAGDMVIKIVDEYREAVARLPG